MMVLLVCYLEGGTKFNSNHNIQGHIIQVYAVSQNLANTRPKPNVLYFGLGRLLSFFSTGLAVNLLTHFFLAADVYQNQQCLLSI